jgi:UDP-2,4-diacetamido-2,4,6-trideoxy-beta-L-altropyranose hydrolase
MKWLFRQVTLKDSAQLLSWRNDPEIYRYLFNAAPIAATVHEQWLAKATVDPSVLFLIANYDGRDAGTIRFDFSDSFSVAEVGIYLAPEWHGKGLGSSLLAEAEEVAKTQFVGLKRIVAKVLPDNLASEKMFARTGYQKKFIQLEKILEG